MNILLLLILISSLPVLFLYLWFRLSRFSPPRGWFSLFLLAGVLSLLAALVLQRLLPEIPPGSGGIGRVFYRVFCEVALTEEAGRFLVFLVFFRIAARFSGQPGSGAAPAPEFWGALAGLTAGIGFAVIENTSYGAADMGIAFIRAFTAAPLHGACGARVGVAVVNLRDPFSPLLHFSFAVAIHGMYDLMLLLGGIPWILAILVAFSAFASSILFIRAGFKSSTQSHG